MPRRGVSRNLCIIIMSDVKLWLNESTRCPSMKDIKITLNRTEQLLPCNNPKVFLKWTVNCQPSNGSNKVNKIYK